MMIDVQNKGSRVLSMTKLWTNASETQKNAWHKYALATFLMGSNGNSYFCFHGRQERRRPRGARTLQPDRHRHPDGPTPRSARACMPATSPRARSSSTSSSSGLRLTQAPRTPDGARVSGRSPWLPTRLRSSSTGSARPIRLPYDCSSRRTADRERLALIRTKPSFTVGDALRVGRPTITSTCAGSPLTGQAAPLVGRVMRELVADLDFDAVGADLGADPVAT